MSLLRISMVAAVLSACGSTQSAEESPTLYDDSAEAELRTGYRMDLKSTPSPVVTGQPASLAIGIAESNGTAVRAFDLDHTKPMHLIAISQDLKSFMHVHPDLNSAGTFSIDHLTFDLNVPYKLFAEFDPEGPVGEKLLTKRLSPRGARSVKAALDTLDAFDGLASKTYKVGDGASYATTIVLAKTASGMLMEDESTDLSVELRDSNTHKPVADLVNWLGMPAHAIVASENLRTFQHLHGMPSSAAQGSGMGGMDHGATETSKLVFTAKFPSAGAYKMWLQFQRGNQLATAPIVLAVASKSNH